MKLKEMLKENGCYATFDNMGFGAEKVLAGLGEEADAQYCKYQWFDGGMIVHAIPTPDMLEAGLPWEEWYKRSQHRQLRTSHSLPLEDR